MLVATVTALIILFSGSYEIFFAENVEKGIKEYVEEKDRRKELLDLTKQIKSRAKSYNKERKAYYKDFKELYTNYNTTEEELVSFFDGITEVQSKYQSDFVDLRIEITDKIEEDEWDRIVEFSGEAYRKKLEKQAKKNKKYKDPFVKTRKTIGEIQDQKSQEAVNSQLDAFVENVSAFEKSLKEINVLDDELLVEKSNSKEDLLTLYDNMNKIRQEAFKSVIEFHSVVRNNLEQEQGEIVLAAFYKDLELAPM
jgi:uncharacterized protein YlxW (UPF0749 family)